MRKQVLFLTSLLCVSLICSACSQGNSKATSGNKTDNGEIIINNLDIIRPAEYSSMEGLSMDAGSYISLIACDTEDVYWQEVEKGAKQAVKDLNALMNYKNDDKIKLSYNGPRTKNDVDDQVSLLDEELARYPVAVGISTVDSKSCGVQFDLAKEDGIPIITYSSNNENQNMNAHVGTDNFNASKTAATELAQAIGGKGEVAVFVHDSSLTAKNRLDGFTSTIENDFPDIEVVSTYSFSDIDAMREAIAAEVSASLEKPDAQINPNDLTQEDVIQYILAKHPNIKGIYTTDASSTQLVADVLTDEQNESLAFVGFDGGKSQMDLLENGVLDGVIVQNPYGMGYATIVAIARANLGLTNDTFIDTGYVWVTKENKDSASVRELLY